jgi:2-(1,2-epoxy-1,2-dihydrophenyl)acetyl-CoA isomerase
MSLVLTDWDEENGIARLTFNRPDALNAISIPMSQAFNTAVQSIVAREPRCIVLAGAGRAFVAGGDLKRFADDFDGAAGVVDELLDAIHPAILALQACNAPVLASVHGAVAGAGLALMAGADLIIAEQETRFLLAYDRIGAAPDSGGTWFLARRLKRGALMRLMMLSETWDSDQARQEGLIDRIAAKGMLVSETQALSLELARRPTWAMGTFKRLLALSEQSGLSDQLEQERLAFRLATKTSDFREGVSAFLERRSPRYQGG